MVKMKRSKGYPIYSKGSVKITEEDRIYLEYLKDKTGKALAQLIRDEVLKTTDKDLEKFHSNNCTISTYWSEEDIDFISKLVDSKEGLTRRHIIYDAVCRLRRKKPEDIVK